MASNHVVGVLYTLCSGLFFGLLGFFGLKLMQADLSVYTMLFWRFLICSLFIAFFSFSVLNRRACYTKAALKIILYGIAFYSTCSIFYFLAAERIGSGLAMVIFFVYPVIVMLIERFSHHRAFSKIYIVAIIIILIGMYGLIHGQKITFDMYGIFLSTLSAVLYALYIFFSKTNPTPVLPATLMLSIGCVIICFFAALADHSFQVPYSFSIWINILAIAIICTALPIIFLLEGLKRISATQAAILSVLEPVFVVIFGILLLDEKVSVVQCFSIIIILGGSLLSLLEQPH